jgi:hypothetical protein
VVASVGVARAAAPFTRGVDCMSPVQNNVARMLKADGYEFVGRYVESLSTYERDGIFAAGLAIAPLTYAITGVALTAALGAEIGGERARELQSLGCPTTVHLWADHESPHPGSDSIRYLNARADATIATGFGAGQYGGMPFDLTAAEFYGLKASRYWRGGGAVPEPACGFCVLQLCPLDQTIHGQRFDVDVIQADFQGRTPILWCPT